MMLLAPVLTLILLVLFPQHATSFVKVCGENRCECQDPVRNVITCGDLSGRACVSCTSRYVKNCVDFDEKCSTNNSTRRELLTYSGSEEEYHSIVQNCGDLRYEASLFVTDHLYAVAIPSVAARAAGCPLIATHAEFSNQRSSEGHEPTASKEVLVYHEIRDGLSFFNREGSFPLGTFQLFELAEAFEQSEVDSC